MPLKKAAIELMPHSKCRLQNSGKKITINMAPADLRKEGSAYDLDIAIGILAASDLIKAENLEKYIIMANFP